MDLPVPYVKVLIIDDSEDDRFALQRLLRKAATYQFDFIEAETASNAKQYLDQHRDVDCIFLDYNLPDLSGIEILDELSGSGTPRRIPIIMLTGQGSEAVAVSAIKRGAYDYLVKDEITADIIIRSITGAIRQRELANRLAEEELKRREIEDKLTKSMMDAAELAGIQKTIATLAHEINNPLTGAIGMLKMVLEDPQLGEDNQSMLSDTLSAIKRIETAVRKITEMESPVYRTYLKSTKIIDLRNKPDAMGTEDE